MRSRLTFSILAALLLSCGNNLPQPEPPRPAPAPTSTARDEEPAAVSAAPEPETPAAASEPVQPLEPLSVAAPPPPKPDPNAPADLTTPPADAEQTPSGLISKVLAPGSGTEHPRAEDTIVVNFTGWMQSGIKFDSTDGGKPVEYKLDRMIRGWIEGIPLMVTGEKRRFWIPGRLAYGDDLRRFSQPYGTLVFDVELLAIKHPPAPPVVPTDLTAPPADAVHTKSGIVYRVLQKGTGKVHPRARSTVEVHYSGWTLDGRMFDSSVARGETATFPLDHVIRGWTEGVQLMVVGEKARFWIPSLLAYGDNPGADSPAGTLVFDIELIAIK